MSVRGLNDGGDSDVQRIYQVAEAKGLELDDIEVERDTTEDGDDVKRFLVYAEKGETEKDSVGIQLTKMVGMQMGDASFQQTMDTKLSKLLRYVRSDGESNSDTSQEDVPDPDERGVEQEQEQEQQQEQEQVQSKSVGDIINDDVENPGEALDQKLDLMDRRLSEIEHRLDELESKSEALDGLQKLMQGDTGNES